MDSNLREPAAKSTADEPLFLASAREMAAKRGVSLEDVLAADRKAAEVPAFPTSECLLPEDAEDILLAQKVGDGAPSIAQEKTAHLAECLFCQTMVSSLEPSLDRQEEFIKVVRHETRYGAMDSFGKRVSALGRLTWPIALPVLAVLTLLLAGHLSSDGWLLTATIKSEAAILLLQLGIPVITVVVVFFTVMQRPRLPLVARFVFTLSMTIGVTTAVGVMLYTGNEWRDASVALRSSEDILVKRLAGSYEIKEAQGAFPAIVDLEHGTQINTLGNGKEFATYRASSKDMPGALVARARKDKGQISVDVGGKEYDALAITIGKVERVSEKRYRVVSANGESVYGNLIYPGHAIADGVTAMAVKRFGKEESPAELHPLRTVSLIKQQ